MAWYSLQTMFTSIHTHKTRLRLSGQSLHTVAYGSMDKHTQPQNTGGFDFKGASWLEWCVLQVSLIDTYTHTHTHTYAHMYASTSKHDICIHLQTDIHMHVAAAPCLHVTQQRHKQRWSMRSTLHYETNTIVGDGTIEPALQGEKMWCTLRLVPDLELCSQQDINACLYIHMYCRYSHVGQTHTGVPQTVMRSGRKAFQLALSIYWHIQHDYNQSKNTATQLHAARSVLCTQAQMKCGQVSGAPLLEDGTPQRRCFSINKASQCTTCCGLPQSYNDDCMYALWLAAVPVYTGHVLLNWKRLTNTFCEVLHGALSLCSL